MGLADLLRHPLVIALIMFVLGQAVAVTISLIRISTAVKLLSVTDENLLKTIERIDARVERLEDAVFVPRNGR